MSYCKNCGTDIGSSVFCSNCGTKSSKKLAPIVASKKNYKNLSFIVISALSVIGIVLLFIKGYFEYYSKSSGSYYSDSFYASGSYFDLGDSAIFGIFAIMLLLAPAIICIANLKFSNKVLRWVNVGCCGTGFMYMIITSVLLRDSFYEYNKGSYNGYYYSYLRSFESFEFLFYLLLTIFAAMIVLCVFDALEKPLIRKKLEEESCATSSLEI